ncbi:carbohydrate ABC transporter permease [Paenibacillus thermoaerophilus]|uniref:Carbohydrate ABC transporter permease n=1 Tax=Paenibacillus thermoaerophilus TaxID=1215385 RepID=A0ABW2V5U8_9BACL|nr:carbohydrate ABC transporter permease [Paenibacillus thermoaerophilus]TMV11015.1 carbohydrate ABC transporter permease [Paenibacillus thermoaerophilus]
MEQRYTGRTFALEVFAIVLGLLFLVPFYFVLSNSFKPFSELLSHTVALPSAPTLDNYQRAWEIMKFPRAFMNSLIITVVSIVGLTVISSMAAYRMVRYPSGFNRLAFGLFVAAMVIPFQSIMIPLVSVAKEFGLFGSRTGLIICYFGFGVPLSVFLYHGFVKSIPLEIEESARVDGCSKFGVYWRIVFPLLKPMTVTIALLNSLWIWNDFLLPSIVLGLKPETRTIPLATYSFFGQYTKQWDLALAGLVLGVTPIIIFFLSLQKHIIEGITAGSVKG